VRPSASQQLRHRYKANKTRALGIPTSLLQDKGAVCRDVADGTAHRALTRSPADERSPSPAWPGPDPDEDSNPVGRVRIGLVRVGAMRGLEYNYGKLEREAVQARAMTDALTLLVAMLEEC
jgi:nicotinamide-nucleotide amidase